ncbi:MAG TPA: metalloregulator ArsR/SmtB family transcription factor [Ornithinibacter sp.]|nr:metalloregulator ArsR/SmtB family transcription factor [Ornithinibacter sp.]
MPSTTTLPVAAPACCGIGVDGGLTRAAAETSATLLKAVADPVRLQLLSAIRATEAGEACVCDLTPVVGLSQPTVSHHLKVLVEAGLLEREKRGTWAWFRLVPARLDEVAAIFR